MMHRLTKFPAQVASFVVFSIRRFYTDGLGQSAGALTYSTLLALVPLMVITFAILSGFPAFDMVRERMEAMFFDIFVPEVGVEVENYLSEFSRNANNLTAVGVAALSFTAVLLLWTIEATLNQIWRVEHPRPIGVRLLIYWTVLTLGPLLLGLSFVLSSGVLSSAGQWIDRGPVSRINDTIRVMSGVAVQSMAFMLLFRLVPARPVRLRDAAIGGVISGVAFYLLRWGFNSFLTSGTTYETIYGAVAVLPIFLVWIYSSWTVIIMGAVFAASFPDWWKTREPMAGVNLPPARRLEVAVAILAILSRQAQRGGAVSLADLQDAVPLDARDQMLEALVNCGYVIRTEGDCLSLIRDLYTTRIIDLAQDLKLSLGLSTSDAAEEEWNSPALHGISEATGELPQILSALRTAEGTILARPLAEVVERPALQIVGQGTPRPN